MTFGQARAVERLPTATEGCLRRLDDGLRVPRDDLNIGPRSLVRLSAVLLPVTQRAGGDVENFRELGLRQAELQRMRLANDTRRAGPTLSGRRSSRGMASRSRRAAARTSVSVMALSCVQSAAVMPYLSRLPVLSDLTVRLSRGLAAVVALLTFGCLSGRKTSRAEDDAA